MNKEPLPQQNEVRIASIMIKGYEPVEELVSQVLRLVNDEGVKGRDFSHHEHTHQDTPQYIE